MTQIFFDLRGIFGFPVTRQIRMAGMTRTILEWGKSLAPSGEVTFVAPGYNHLIRGALAEDPAMHGVLAAFPTTERRELSEIIALRLPPPMTESDPMSKARRRLAIAIHKQLFPRCTEALLHRMSRPQGSRAIYFQPSVQSLPRRLPTWCIPVMNVYDLIPLVFKDRGKVGNPDYAAAIRSVQNLNGHFIVNSKHVRHSLICMFEVPPEQVHVVALGALPPATTPEAADTVPQRPYFLHISGDCQRRKNVEGTVRAFAKYCDMTPEPYDLRIVGPSESDLREIKAIHGGNWNHRIFAEGKVSELKLDYLIRHAKWGLYLSLYEGFGLPPLEFMSRGVPVIASSATSVPESVGGAGILVDPLDREAIAATFLEVTRYPDLDAKFIAKGLLRAADLTWPRSAECLKVTLRSILSSEAAPSQVK